MVVMVVSVSRLAMVYSNPLVMERRRVASMSGWVQRVVSMVWGERAIGAGV